MVSALLETVNGEIRKSKPTQLDQTSPVKRSPQRKSPSAQGLARQSPRRQPGSSPLAKKSKGANVGGIIDVTSDKASPDSFSDYGDDDFDDATLLELDANILGQRDDSTLVASSEGSNQQARPLQKAVDDEFNDFDDDVFDGAEDLVAQVEAKHASQSQFQGQQHAKPANNWGGDDDAYGDDFDDADFDAVELAATQTASRSFPSNVRTTG
jgi:DNA replication ATP-dependent helicase Dna2